MQSKGRWRLLDTGHRSASENMALDRVILEARARGEAPDTVRFLQFSRTSALVGYHQDLEQEIRLDFCNTEGIEVNRRITGGGAIIFEPSHIGWEVIGRRDDPILGGPPQRTARRISEIVSMALKEEFGLEASFRPRNDIEVRGRKISGTGGTWEGDAFLFQGTLLVDLDVWRMLRALKVPMEKLKAHEVDSIMDRVTTLKAELGYIPDGQRVKEAIVRTFSRELGVVPEPSGLTPWEEARLGELLPEFNSEKWIQGKSNASRKRGLIKSIWRGEGGVIRLLLDLDLSPRRIRSVVISGDFFSFPARAVYELESRFKDVPATMEAVEGVLDGFFSGGQSPFPSLDARDFLTAFERALGKIAYLEMGFSPEETHDLFPVCGGLGEILERGPEWILLPYCSKDLGCELRNRDGCYECGLCSIGDGYALARNYGLGALTITSFEDLMEKLLRLRAVGARGFVGCCCEGFYVKHAEDFEEAGVPGVLVGMDSTTCYDLGKARDAYHGQFEHQTHINLHLLRKVLSLSRRAA